MRKAEEKWGNGIVEQVSLDLQNEFPNVKGFSARNHFIVVIFTSEIRTDQNIIIEYKLSMLGMVYFGKWRIKQWLTNM